MVDKPSETPLLAKDSALRSAAMPTLKMNTLSVQAEALDKGTTEITEIQEFLFPRLGSRGQGGNQPGSQAGFFNTILPKNPSYTKLLVGSDQKIVLVSGGKFLVKENRMRPRGEGEKVTNKEITSLCFAYDGKKTFLVLGDSEGTVYRYLYNDLNVKESFKLNGRINKLKYCKYRNSLFSACGSLFEFSVKDWQYKEIYQGEVFDLDSNEDNLVFCGQTVELAGKQDIRLSEERHDCVSISKEFVAAAKADKISVWNKDTQLYKIFQHESVPKNLCLSNNEVELGVFSEDGSVKVWHLTENYKPKVLNHSKKIKFVEWSEDLSSIHFLTEELIDKYSLGNWTEEKYFSVNGKIENFTSINSHLIWSSDQSINLYSLEKSDVSSVEATKVSKIVAFEDLFYVLSNEKTILQYSFDLNSESLVTADEGLTISDFSVNKSQLVYALSNSFIVFFSLAERKETIKIDRSFRGRPVPIKNIQLFQNSFFYTNEASLIKILYSDTANAENCFMDWQGKVSLAKVSNDENIVLKTDAIQKGQPVSNNFKIYYSGRQKFIKEVSSHKAQVTNFEFTPDDLYFLVSSMDGSISLWCKDTLNMITYMNYGKPVLSFGLCNENSNLAIVQEGEILLMNNPTNTAGIQVFGPDASLTYEVLNYFNKIVVHAEKDEETRIKMSPYSQDMDDYVISPSLMSPLHFYAWFQYGDAFIQALGNDKPFFNTKSGLNPLYLMLAHDEQDPVIKTINCQAASSHKNPFLYGYINIKTLKELNIRGYPGTEVFYESIFKPFTKIGLPRYLEDDSSLPIIVSSNFAEPKKTNFFPTENYKKDGVPIVFFSSCIKVNMTPGSQDSLDFLKSLESCPNQEVFTKPFIRMILTEKWKKVKWVMSLQGVVYLAYFICLVGFIVNYGNSFADTEKPEERPEEKAAAHFFLYTGMGINTLLTLYELYQIFKLGREYFSDIWNYVDIIRFILYTILTIIISFTTENLMLNEYFVVLVLFTIIFSWVRGLTYFRIFDSVRYLTALIFQVMSDMISFTVLATYAVLGLSLMLYSCSETNSGNKYMELLGFTYMTTIGEYASFDKDVKDFQSLGILIFTLTSIFNTIIMMNLLISIIGDTFDRVQQGSNVTDLKELIEMIYEVESLQSWNLGIKESVFLQKLTSKYGSGGEIGVWEGKIRELMKIITSVKVDLKDAIEAVKKDNQEDSKAQETLQKKIEDLEAKHDNDMMEIKVALAKIFAKLPN